MAQTSPEAAKAKILELLDEHRIMSLSTLRPDGWPQTTMVGYVHDDLTLYFAVARSSQKFENMKRDPRVSIAIGHDEANRIRGISMAATVEEMVELADIERLNALIFQRYPEQSVFAPRQTSSAVFRADPTIVSLVDLTKAPGAPELWEVGRKTVLRRPA